MNNNNKENIEQEKINKRSWWRNVGLWKTRHFAQNLKILAKVVKPNLQSNTSRDVEEFFKNCRLVVDSLKH